MLLWSLDSVCGSMAQLSCVLCRQILMDVVNYLLRIIAVDATNRIGIGVENGQHMQEHQMLSLVPHYRHFIIIIIIDAALRCGHKADDQTNGENIKM